ncbi:hypothetical protein AAC978_00870 [Desulfitobacterium sp. THU1]|uniref:hypothetical protein n=1 Tax=Desulfitobacterium sp. THU1 TaxID=3138072 RepID=UPI00311F7DD9
MLKKIIVALAFVMVVALTGCSSDTQLTLEDLAKEKNLSVGELNTDYLLNHQYKHDDGTFMSINITDIKVEKEIVLEKTTLHQSIVLASTETMDRAKKMINDALFFEVYTDKGRKGNLDIRMYLRETEDGKSDIILNCEKFDMTLFDYLVLGPAEEAQNERLVFAIPH